MSTTIDRLGISLADHRLAVSRLFESLWPFGNLEYERRGGVHGFQASSLVTVAGAHVAMWAYGGDSQKGRSYVDISGVGCQLVGDWENALERVLELPEPIIKRVDIAADFYGGEVSYEDTLAAYEAGKFKRERGGRMPRLLQMLPGTEQEGRTLYVGKPGNDVYFRAYEKGKKERHQEFPEWMRLEVELRSAKRPLPFEVIPMRDQYFAGCYPYLAQVLPEVSPEILIYPQRVALAELDYLLACIRAQYGSTLYSALVAYEGDITAIWEKIVGDHHNQRLVKAGLLVKV